MPAGLLTPPSAGASFADNLDTMLAPRLKPDEPLYALLRRYDASPRFVAVTYVPDAAKVRQKMLFASTRLALVRELGTEHFRETIFATSPADLTPSGFEKHDAHGALAAPLTEEERTLGDVKRAEQEAGSGTGAREIHLSKNLNIPVGEDALAALRELGQEGGGKRSLVMLVSLMARAHLECRMDWVGVGWLTVELFYCAFQRKSTPRPKRSSSCPTPRRRRPSPS